MHVNAGVVREAAAQVLITASEPFVTTQDAFQQRKEAAMVIQRFWRARRAVKQRKLACRKALVTLRGSLVFRQVPPSA
jgi:hypothetical protein